MSLLNQVNSDPQWQKLLNSLKNNLNIDIQQSDSGRLINMAEESKCFFNSPEVFYLLMEISRGNLQESLTKFVHYLLKVETIKAAAIYLFNDTHFELLTLNSIYAQMDGLFKQSLCWHTLNQTFMAIDHRALKPGQEPLMMNTQEPYRELIGIDDVLCIPLFHFGEIQGLLVLFVTDILSFKKFCMNWITKALPMLATLLYKHKLRLSTASKERALSLLLRENEILVRAQSEEELLNEAGEIAQEILFIESGFFLMFRENGSWEIQSPFGKLRGNDSSWHAEVEKLINSPDFQNPTESYALIHTQRELPGLGKHILIHPLITHSGIWGQLWLGNFQYKLSEQNQEILTALVRGVGVALETIRQREQLELLAMTDPLTGILNRQGFERRIREEIAATLRRNSTFLFLILDLDGFKKINDAKGHLAGDNVLKQIAQIIKTSVREQDIVARTGGDEFALVLTDINLNEEALEIVQRVHNQISSANLGLGVCIGVAEFPSEGTRYDELYRIADQRLYLGKGTGKGKIVIK